MKRVLLSILAAGVFVGQASAGMYVLDSTTAMQFDTWAVSAGDSGVMLVGPTTNVGEYTGTMQGDVGWIGLLMDQTWDNLAAMTISAGGNLGYSGSHDGFRAFLANDDDDPWSVRLFVTTSGPGGGTFYSDGGFQPLAGHTSTWLTVSTPFSFSAVTDFGFEVQGVFGLGHPSNPDVFKISAVPVPGAALLGVLGLLAAGARLRQSAAKK